MRAKIFVVVAVIIAVASILAGCNQVLDTTYHFDRAIISMPDGTILDGVVDSWCDYEGDQLQVKVDGITYLVHSSDVVLITKRK